MSDTSTQKRTQTTTKVQKPRLHKVLLVNDDFTPREFVVKVLKAVFGLSEDQANARMMVAHQKGVCTIAVYTREVAESKAEQAIEAGQQNGFPLMFTTEPEE